MLALSAFSVAAATLSGCGIGTIATGSSNAVVDEAQIIPAVRINGHVHGGAFPIQGATVILTETQSNGVWTPANAAYVGTAKPLYVTTSDKNGSFTFPDTGWGCDAGQYVYIEVTGGHTATANNANVVQLGAVGDCSADLGNKAEIDGINVFLSEPSTVAAAYALRSFISIHNGTLTGTASDGTATLGTTIPLADITAPANNNAVPLNPALNPASTATGAVEMSLAGSYNTSAIYTDGRTFNSGGFDQDGNAYSYTQVGSSLSYAGVPYALGPVNAPDAVSGNGAPTIALTSGTFNQLNILAAGVNGAQANQTFTVTYSDGTSTNFTQGIDDWYNNGLNNYAGESVALTTTYRNESNGTKDNRSFNIYQYSFAVNKAKLVKSLTLPSNKNVVVLAITGTTNLPACSGVRAGTALACTAAGLAHGFQNAYNLVDQVTFSGQMPTGLSRSTLPGNSTAVAPREMINTLGNILQECVDSAGGTVGTYSSYAPGTSRCGDLFYYTTPPGSTTSPTNTLQAAINMATYPTNNVSQLMALKPRNVFFTPENAQITQPFAFTLSIFYKGTNLGDTFATPGDLALDVQDNLYVAYGQTTGVLDELTASGTGVFSTKLTSVANPKTVALDTNGYVWVADDTPSTGGVTGLYTSVNATQSAAQGSTYKTITIANGSVAGLAFDASSNMLVTRDSGDQNNTAFIFTAASSYTSGVSGALGFPIQHIAANSEGNFYGVGTNGSTSEWFNYNYTTCTNPVPTVSQISASGGATMAVNNNVGTTGAYSAFVPSSGQVNSFLGGNCQGSQNSSPAGNDTGLTSTSPTGTAMDGNLNLFWTDSATGLIYDMAGAGSSTNISGAAITSFAPCYFSGGACVSTSTAKYLGMAIDSSGAMWHLSRGGTYGLVQTFGVASPTWPLLSSENSGVTVQ